MFESEYLNLADRLVQTGSKRIGRNGGTRSLPFETLEFDLSGGEFPLLTSRRINYQGALGEYAAMIRGPQHVSDFHEWNCNFWNRNADADTGNLTLDYGNAWRDYNGVNQMESVLDSLKHRPYDRRMLITGWRPDRLNDLSLPCCHYGYQFYVDNEDYVHLLWQQRSADIMLGVPNDAVVAAVMLLCFADLCGRKPGRVKMMLGDAHIYESHIENFLQQREAECTLPPSYMFGKQTDLYSFEPQDLIILKYRPNPIIKYKLAV